jgi:hypothetical protein
MVGPQRQRGFLLIVAVILIAVAATMAAVIVTLTAGSGRAGGGHAASTQALYIAESGAERATRLVLSPTVSERVTCPSVTGNANVTNIAVGSGVYTVTGTTAVYPAAAATLNGALNATAPVIPFNSTLAGPTYGMAASGRVLIDREAIDYSGISTSAAVCGTAPCLTGAQRGRDGTTATTHATGTRLGQYQCNLVSAGGVPNLTAAERGQRTLNQGVQFQEGWATGLGAAAFPTAQNLNGVFCFPGGTECWAVGNAGTILRWNGATWGTVASSVGSILRAVTCTSTTNCFAVGDTTGGNDVILQWNGFNWTRLGGAGGLGTVDNRNLLGVTCAGASYCWAVGNQGGAANRRPWFVVWDGANWTNYDSTLINVNTVLNSVYCVAVNDCWAVGNAVGGAGAGETIFRRSGASWARTGPLGTVDNRNLRGIYCVATNDCWAVGVQGGPANRRPWIVRWNGAWNNYDSTLGLNTTLNSVTCADATNCWAVGNLIGNNFTIVRGDGTNWIDQSLLTDAAYVRNLNGVSCLNANDCWAVGDAGRIVRWNGTYWSLYGVNATVLRWNTTNWTNVSSTLVPGGITQLNSVSPLSYADGWAVGNRTAATTAGWNLLRWNGAIWTRFSSVTPNTTAQDLRSVYPLSFTDAWAVGVRSAAAANGWMFLRWNNPTANAWNRITVNTPGTTAQDLNYVHMVSATDGWAVGNVLAAGPANQRWAFLRWNNPTVNTWNRYTVTTAGANAQNLNSVSMISATDGWAVGNRLGAAVNQWVFLRWNNPTANTWNRYTVNTPGAAAQNLNSVSMLSATDGWAVGNRLGAATNQWVFLRWNNPTANTWNRYTVTTAGVGAQDLQEVACIHANDCWAIGNAGARLHWNGSTWEAVTTPAVTNNLFGLGLIGSRQRPHTAWTESLP